MRASLGDPDLRGERMKYGIDKWTSLYYVDRGYVALLRWDRLQHVSPIDPGERQDLERRTRVQREVVPLVRVGASDAHVIEQFGQPDVVDTEAIENGTRWIHRTLYGVRPTLGQRVPTGTVYLYFTEHDLFVELQDNYVKTARAMYEHNWEQVREYLAKKGRRPRGEPRAMDASPA